MNDEKLKKANIKIVYSMIRKIQVDKSQNKKNVATKKSTNIIYQVMSY